MEERKLRGAKSSPRKVPCVSMIEFVYWIRPNQSWTFCLHFARVKIMIRTKGEQYKKNFLLQKISLCPPPLPLIFFSSCFYVCFQLSSLFYVSILHKRKVFFAHTLVNTFKIYTICSANQVLQIRILTGSVSLFLCLPASVFFLCLSFWLSVFLSFCPFASLPFCLSVLLSFCLSVFLSFCLSVLLSFCPSDSLSFCRSVLCYSVFLSFCLSVILSFCVVKLEGL